MQTGVLSSELCAAVGTHIKDTLLLPWRLTGILLVSKMFNRMLPASQSMHLQETDVIWQGNMKTNRMIISSNQWVNA